MGYKYMIVSTPPLHPHQDYVKTRECNLVLAFLDKTKKHDQTDSVP